MPAAFTTWTVLPHQPIDRLTDNLWTVDGDLNGIPRRMACVRLDDGQVIVHNAIALADAEMAALEAWGEVAAIVVPNAYHRQDARIWKDRYPNAKVYCPGGATKAVTKVVPVDGSLADAPGDARVKVRHLAGVKDAEGVIEVQSADGVSFVLNDVVANGPPASFPMSVILHPTGRPSVPRIVRWMMIKDNAAMRGELERMASTDGLQRVIMSHGKPFVGDGGAGLRSAIETM